MGFYPPHLAIEWRKWKPKNVNEPSFDLVWITNTKVTTPKLSGCHLQKEKPLNSEQGFRHLVNTIVLYIHHNQLLFSMHLNHINWCENNDKYIILDSLRSFVSAQIRNDSLNKKHSATKNSNDFVITQDEFKRIVQTATFSSYIFTLFDPCHSGEIETSSMIQLIQFNIG